MDYLGIKVTPNSTSKEIAPIALAINEMVAGLPVTMRALNKRGVRVEKGKVMDYDYSGPILEMALETNSTIKTIPETGTYKGIPIVVSTIKNEIGNAVIAIGVVDVIKRLEL